MKAKRERVAKNIEYDRDRKLYYVTFYYGVVDGKRKQKRKTFKNKKDAQKALLQFELEKANGTAVEPSQMTLKELLQLWMESKEVEVARTTYRGYENIVNHIIPILGNEKVQRYKSVLSAPCKKTPHTAFVSFGSAHFTLSFAISRVNYITSP